MLVSGLVWKTAVSFALRLGWSRHSRRQQQFFPVGEDVFRDWNGPLTRFTFWITSALNWILHCRDLQHRSLPFNIQCIQFALHDTGIGHMGCTTRSNVSLSEKERNLETDFV